jgi:hypothetical protein
MPTFETFVIAVYLLIDAYLQTEPPAPRRRGRPPGLNRGEVLTLALLAQLDRFPSERAFARYAATGLRDLFPGLPERTGLNRAFRAHTEDLVRFGRWCARRLGAQTAPYEVLDTTAWPLRNAKRRGEGTLPEVVAIGRSLRLGWFEGVRVLITVTPEGAVTGYGIAAGNAQDRPIAESFLAQRAEPVQVVPAVGRPANGIYLADAGFGGRDVRQRWAAAYDAHVYVPPKRDSAEWWPPALRRWHKHARQIVETVVQRLVQGFRLERERPRTMSGVLLRLAAKVAVHNALMCWNRASGRPDLAYATAVGW